MSHNVHDRFGMIDTFMPMNLIYDAEFRVVHAGPTFQKVFGGRDPSGMWVQDVLTLRDDGRFPDYVPGQLPTNALIYVRLNAGSETQLKGMAVKIPNSPFSMVNLSFGISLVDVVTEFRLTASDFAQTDLAIELLYLVEAKSAVLEETKQLNQRLQGAKVAAEEQAFTDTLTGLGNRRAMDQVLARMLRGGAPFALMHLDLDYFKSVNDTLGHAAGDAVLEKVAQVLTKEVRADDLVARVGGDEFILLFHKFVDKDRLMRTAFRIIEQLEVPVPFGDEECRISGSIGITTTEFYTEPTAEEMIRDADLALYHSKDEGRGRPTMFETVLRDMPAPAPEALQARR